MRFKKAAAVAVMTATFGLLPMALSAATPPRGKVETSEIPAIIANMDEIRGELSTRGSDLAKLPAAKRRELEHQQSIVYGLLNGRSHVDELTLDQRIRVNNALEGIHAIMVQAPEERVICRRERTVGSHRQVTSCRTAAQREADREEALRSWTPRNPSLGSD